MIMVENCPDICFLILNLLTSPLIKCIVNLIGRSKTKVGWKMSDDWPLS